MSEKQLPVIEKLALPFDDKLKRHRTIIRRQKEVVLDYIPGNKVVERLNQCLGLNWSFSVVDRIVDFGRGQIAVLGRLTVDNSTTEEMSHFEPTETKAAADGTQEAVAGTLDTILRSDEGKTVKEQWGGTTISLNGAGRVVSLGDDLKIATTDALKKCASLLGVALYLYGDDDNGDDSGPEVPPPSKDRVEQLRGQVAEGSEQRPDAQPESAGCTAQQVEAIRKVLAQEKAEEKALLAELGLDALEKLDRAAAGAIITLRHPFWSKKEGAKK